MALVKGGFQRLFQTFLYFLLFLCSAVILGIFSYFLSVLADRNLHIPTWEKAVEGIAGAAVIYTLMATILTCCLGGITVLALIAIVLDVLFCAGMIAIAVMTRNGADSCKGNVNTPLGSGPASQDNGFGKGDNNHVTYSVHLGLACRLETAVFAVAIIAALLFICTAVMQLLLIRHHKKEKRYGPSPSNNYTSGYGKFGRKKKTTPVSDKDAEAGVAQPGSAYSADAPSYGGAPTHTGAPTHSAGTYDGPPVYGAPAHGGHSGYYTQPTGTASQNPYGYANQATNY